MPSRVTSPIFVGRVAEFERIVAKLREAEEGSSGTLLIGGEAGIGKTRLVEEGAATARAAGFRVLSGGCMELAEGSFPFGPFVGALRGLAKEIPPAELEELAGAGRSELQHLMPALRRPGDRLEETGDPARGRLFELCAGFLVRLSATRPLLLILEDLHWADRSTLDLARYLVRALRDGPTVILATYRSDELHRRHPLFAVLAELGRVGHVERLELKPLDASTLAALLGGILGAGPDRDLAEQIYSRSQGNPFFAEELLAARTTNQYLPDSLREVLLVRLAALSESTQKLLWVAAAGGSRVSGSLLAAVLRQPEAALVPALREAVDRHVLSPTAPPAEPGYTFRHALFQEALYAELLPDERTALHRAYASALAPDGGAADDAGHAAELASHWLAARDLPRAFDAAIAAGRAAEHAYAFPEAQQQFERALELWDRVPDAAARSPLDRAALLEGAARSAEAAGSPSEAIALIRLALGLVDPGADPIRAGMLSERLGHYHSEIADGEGAIAACRDAVRIVPILPDSEARARALAGLGRCLVIYGHPREAAPFCEEAIAVARKVGAAEIEAHALISRANCLGYFGDWEGAIIDSLEAREIGLRVAAPDVVVRAYYALGFLYAVHAKRYDEAAAVNLEGFEYAERNGLVRTAATSGLDLLAGAAVGFYNLGRWDDTAEVLERGRRAGADETESRPFHFHGIRIALDIGRGRLAEAEQRLDRVERLDERAAELEWVAMTGLLRAELAIWQGDPWRARMTVAERLRRLTGAGELADVDDLGALYALGLRAEADLAAIDRSRHAAEEVAAARATARAYLEQMRAAAHAAERERPAAASMANADLALCEAEFTRLDGRSSVAAWSAAASAWDALQTPYRRAYALYREAEALLAVAGGRKRAEAPLRAAHAIASALGANPLREEIEGLAVRGRVELGVSTSVPVEPPPATNIPRLTPREREVLALLATGRTNRQIGETLFISEKTAGVHVSNILGKLGVSGRTEAATMAIRLGIIEPPGRRATTRTDADTAAGRGPATN